MGCGTIANITQRARVTAWREQFTLIGLLLAATVLFLVEQFGDGDTPSIMYGMALAICVTAPVAAILLSVVVKETPPRPIRRISQAILKG